MIIDMKDNFRTWSADTFMTSWMISWPLTRGLSSAYQSNKFLRKSWSNSKIQNFNRTSSFPPNFNFKILTKQLFHNLTKPQQQNTDQTSVSKFCLNLNFNSWPNLVLKVWTNFSFLTKLQLPNLHKTIVKTFLIININNRKKPQQVWVGIFTRHTVTAIKFTKQESVS